MIVSGGAQLSQVGSQPLGIAIQPLVKLYDEDQWIYRFLIDQMTVVGPENRHDPHKGNSEFHRIRPGSTPQ
jgi:hypothetical protein